MGLASEYIYWWFFFPQFLLHFPIIDLNSDDSPYHLVTTNLLSNLRKQNWNLKKDFSFVKVKSILVDILIETNLLQKESTFKMPLKVNFENK